MKGGLPLCSWDIMHRVVHGSKPAKGVNQQGANQQREQGYRRVWRHLCSIQDQIGSHPRDWHSTVRDVLHRQNDDDRGEWFGQQSAWYRGRMSLIYDTDLNSNKAELLGEESEEATHQPPQTPKSLCSRSLKAHASPLTDVNLTCLTGSCLRREGKDLIWSSQLLLSLGAVPGTEAPQSAWLQNSVSSRCTWLSAAPSRLFGRKSRLKHSEFFFCGHMTNKIGYWQEWEQFIKGNGGAFLPFILDIYHCNCPKCLSCRRSADS